MAAVEKYHVGVLKAMLDAGVDPHQRDEEGNTLLMKELSNYRPNQAMVKLWLDAVTDPSVANLQNSGVPRLW